jgi:phosphatidylglycerol:prolipoprotein diacylglycerol transferase
VIAVIEIPFDPVLHLGPLPVHWYGVAYVLAFIVGMQLATPFLRSRGISEQTASSIFWWNIGIGLVGARLYYVIQQPDLSVFLRDSIQVIAVWQGGMAFFGAVMACLATTAVIAYRRRLPIWVLLDAAALFATLPQAIGRLGNIVNGDILGAPSTLPWAVRYTNPHTFAPSTTTSYQPANVYELLTSLLLFGMVLLILSRRPRVGTAGIAYVAGYAISQVLVFFTRSTEPVLLLGLKQAQLTALGVLVIGVPVLLMAWRRYPDAWADGAPQPFAHAVEAPVSTGA